MELAGTRKSRLTEDDVKFNKDAVANFLSSGIAINKLDGHLRQWLQDLASVHLQHPRDLPAYITELIEEEDEGRRLDLWDKVVPLLYDATPRCVISIDVSLVW